ncbi:MAG: hypothetical protein WBP72_13590 [Rhodocyclaceae bacterium]
MSLNPATPRDLIVAGLVSVVGQGVAVVAPHVGPALQHAKAVIARSAEEASPAPSVAAADPELEWARKCVAAWRESVEVAPELLALADSPLDEKLPNECETPAGANPQLAAAPVFQELADPNRSLQAQPNKGMWEGQLDRRSGTREQPSPASARAEPDSAFSNMQLALAPSELDSKRGGFETDGGLQFSFGIERAVYINGQLVTTQTLNNLDLRGGAGNQIASAATAAGQQLTVIQNGDPTRNGFSIPSTAASGTVIQNNLNNQTILTETKINASVNSLQALRSIELGDQLRQALISSARR